MRVQPRFRSMWERYCRGVQAIVYVVDSADHDGLEASKSELHDLLGKPSLAGVPVLVLGNKNDLDGALPQAELIDRLDLKVSSCSRTEAGCRGLLMRAAAAAGTEGARGGGVQHLLQEPEQHRQDPGVAHKPCKGLSVPE